MVNVKKIGLSLLLCSVFSYSFAKEAILNEKVEITQDGKIIGYIQVLTPIDQVKTNNDKTTIKVKGYRFENYPQMIVRDMKRGEIYSEFDEEDTALKNFKLIKKHEDDYGEIWHEVEGEFTIDSKQIAQDSSALYQQAKTTYESSCSMCHHLPAADAYTVNQWPQQVESMSEQVGFDAVTKNLIIKYLQQNAKDAK